MGDVSLIETDGEIFTAEVMTVLQTHYPPQNRTGASSDKWLAEVKGGVGAWQAGDETWWCAQVFRF